VCVLAAFSVVRAFGLLGPPVVSVGLLMAALVLVARRQGASVNDLGLGRADARAGLSYGAAAFGIVLVVLLLAAAVPAANGFLHDARAEITGRQLLYEIAVPIVLLTAVPEEFAFRGVLLGSAGVRWGWWRGSLITSALFGLWHIAPTLHTASGNSAVGGAAASAGGRVLLVLGAVAVTFLAGLAFCWLRLRSRSLLAPVAAHAATNGLALTVAWFAIH
jgi:membrane protease YdiL (CAAX protease family)